MMTISKELAEEHYEEHKDKPFFEALVSFITSGPVVAMQVEGKDVVLQIRNIMGATNPIESTPGSIRGDLATELDKNVVHGSDSDESAERELSLFFGN
jgi:nucleoside-diphosphate kinase